MPRPPLVAALSAALTLPACAGYYEPGALARRPDTWDARRVGCLDVAVRPLRDPVIAFTIGNRCAFPVGVDFRTLTVRAWDEAGNEYSPDVSDPRHELREAVLDGHAEADVALDFPVPRATPRFCVDVARLNADTPSIDPIEMCFHLVHREQWIGGGLL